MAKFKYKMQNILDIKLKLEDSAKNEFAQAAARVLEEEAKLQAIINRKREYEEEGSKLRKAKLRVMDIKNNTEALHILQLQIEEQEGVVELERAKQEKARIKLQIAMQERKTQEKLYENAFEEFKREINAQEGREVDELVSYTYGKKQTADKTVVSEAENG